MEKISRMKHRRTYITIDQKEELQTMFVNGLTPKEAHAKINETAEPKLISQQVYRQHAIFQRNPTCQMQPSAFDPNYVDNMDGIDDSNLDRALKDLIPVDTTGTQFMGKLAASMSETKEYTDISDFKEELKEKAELLAELSVIYSKAYIALEETSMIESWEKEQGNPIWNSIKNFMIRLRDDRIERITS